MIEIENVDRIFGEAQGKGFVALSDVNLSIAEREFVSLLGPSGCGKSTLLRLVCGLDRPNSGRIVVGDGNRRAGFQDIGVVFQKPNLLPWLSVLDNVLYPARVLFGRPGRDIVERARHLLDLVGLARVADQRPDSLSGGMQQRAAICRAMALDPAILVMDEPFSALDAMTREELQFETMRLHHATGKTILFVTHSISEAILMSSRIAVMAAGPGRIVETMQVDLARPRTIEMLATPDTSSLDQRIRALIYGKQQPKAVAS